MSFGQTVTLSSGHKIPTLGFGTWQSAPGEVGNAVYEALKAGYRHLDLAKIYQNQKEVAEGIKRAFADIPGLKREDIFITSKLWNTAHRPEQVAPALDDTLQELGLDYLDLYLIHWPVTFVDQGTGLFSRKKDNENSADIDDSVSLSQTWKAMTELPKDKVRTVGVSNFTIEHLESISKNVGVVPAVNQIERHPRLPQPELIDYCAKNNIHITAYSAFGNNSFDLPLLISVPEVTSVAERLSEKYGKPVNGAQVVLAWSKIGGHSVIPKSVTPARIRANFEEIELDDEAIKALAKIGEDPKRMNTPIEYKKPSWEIDVFGSEVEKGTLHKVIL